MSGSGIQTTSREGCELIFETMGEGTPVLLSHPLYTNRGLWTLFHFVELLASRHRVIVYDSIGHGRSAKPPEVSRYAQAERAADAIAVLDALGIERAHGVGYSMGAWTMGAVAALYPERLTSVTIGGWDPYKGANAPNTSVKESSMDRAFENSVKWFQSSEYTAGYMAGADIEALRRCHRVLFDEQVDVARIAACDVPKFVFCGTKDPFFDGAEQLAGAVSADRFEALADADHTTAIGIAPTRTALSEFLAAVDD